MTLKTQLGKSIKYYRNQKNLTQEQLADLVGISDKNISKIEKGNNYPSSETLTAIAKALDTDYYKLFLFDNEINYEQMKNEIINSLDNKNNVIALYQCLKNLL